MSDEQMISESDSSIGEKAFLEKYEAASIEQYKKTISQLTAALSEKTSKRDELHATELQAKDREISRLKRVNADLRKMNAGVIRAKESVDSEANDLRKAIAKQMAIIKILRKNQPATMKIQPRKAIKHSMIQRCDSVLL